MTRDLTRRELLASAAVGSAALGLAACGGGNRAAESQDRTVARRSIAIDHASYYAPYPDLVRLVQDQADRRGASVRFSEDPSGAPAQQASLRRLTGSRGGFGAVVIAAFDPHAIAPIVREAIDRGIEIVSYVTPLEQQTARIVVDARAAARRLVEDAARWAGRNGDGAPRVLVIAPPDRAVVPDPFLPYARAASQAVRNEVAAAGLRVIATATALGRPDAREAVHAVRAAHPEMDVVLSWNDATALGAAEAMPPHGYVGALGAPAISGAAALRALEDGGPLRCLVAPRLSQLANALVDLPLALLRGEPPGSVVVPPAVFRRGSTAAHRAAQRDYASV